MDTKIVIEILKGKKRGSGWMAHCPAHADANPSLFLTLTDTGKLLWKCHAGCSQMQVFEALVRQGAFPKKIRGRK